MKSPLWPAMIGVLYGASPIDLLPDIIPVLGLTDDMAVILICSIYAWKYMRQRQAARATANIRVIPPPK